MRKEGIIARNDSLGRSRSGPIGRQLGEPVVAAVQIDRLSARPGRELQVVEIDAVALRTLRRKADEEPLYGNSQGKIDGDPFPDIISPRSGIIDPLPIGAVAAQLDQTVGRRERSAQREGQIDLVGRKRDVIHDEIRTVVEPDTDVVRTRSSRIAARRSEIIVIDTSPGGGIGHPCRPRTGRILPCGARIGPSRKRRLIEVVVINRLLRNGNLVLACNLDLPRHGLLAFAGGHCNYGCFTRRSRRNGNRPVVLARCRRKHQPFVARNGAPHGIRPHLNGIGRSVVGIERQFLGSKFEGRLEHGFSTGYPHRITLQLRTVIISMDRFDFDAAIIGHLFDPKRAAAPAGRCTELTSGSRRLHLEHPGQSVGHSDRELVFCRILLVENKTRRRQSQLIRRRCFVHRTAVAAPAAAHSQQNKQTGSPKRPQKSSKIGGHRQNNLVE